jgi:uncharacterized peroxidase-related enzyme
MYERNRAAKGYVSNLTQAFSHRPAAYVAWQQLSGAISGGMELRRYEVATLAAARTLRSSYCALAHGQILADQFLGDEGVADLMHGADGADTDPIDAAITRLAEKITASPADVTESDYDELRELGLPDDEIFDVVLAVAARCFFSTVLEATGTEPDHAYESTLSPMLLDVLTVGRPIADH